jgi:hypothetical protein
VVHLLQVKVISYAGTWSRSRRESGAAVVGAGFELVDSWRSAESAEGRLVGRTEEGRSGVNRAVGGVW